VTVIERGDQLARREDADVAAAVYAERSHRPFGASSAIATLSKAHLGGLHHREVLRRTRVLYAYTNRQPIHSAGGRYRRAE
jgi:hypothetical protein